MTNKKLEKAMLNMLKGIKHTQERMEHNQELKTWSDISLPLTLKDVLTMLSMHELGEIRKRLNLKGVSQLKKAELIDLLCSQIPLMLEEVCKEMDLERYQLVKDIIRNGGSILAPKLKSHQFNYLRNSGIFFTGIYEGKRILGMPEELVKHCFFQDGDKEFRDICSRNTEWIKLTNGLLHYYGSLTTHELFDFLEAYTDSSIRVREYLDIIYLAKSYYRNIKIDETGYSNDQVIDPKKVKQEHQMRKDLPFFPFSKEELLKAGEPGYIDITESYIQFVRFLMQNYEVTKKDADGLVKECVHSTNLGEHPNKILQFLSSRLEFKNIDAVRKCMDQAVNLMNNTRQWFLKGYTPNEVSQVQQKASRALTNEKNNILDLNSNKKIGRNDPCPCGSGKKYKNCCGR